VKKKKKLVTVILSVFLTHQMTTD